MRGNLKILAWGALLLLVAAVSYKVFFAAKPEKDEQPRVEAAAAQNESAAVLDLSEKEVASLTINNVGEAAFTPRRSAVGNVDYNQNLLVQVFSPYQGRVIQAGPNVGDRVEKGQVLFTIDSPDLLNAEATLIQNAGLLKLQNVTLARAKQMKSFGGASQQAVDQSTSDQMTAEANLKSAKDVLHVFGKTDAEIDAIIERRKADDHTLVIKSPVTGHVTARNAAPGLLVLPGAAPPSSSATSAAAPLGVYTIADLSTMWMFANVVESDAPLVKPGQSVKAHVQAYPDRVFEGRVVSVGENIDPNSRRVSIRTEIADPEHLLRAGMLATFVIDVGDSKRTLAAPQEAVVREGDGSMTVWVTSDKKHFVRRLIKVGMFQNGMVEILEGMNPGELLVTNNAVFLSNKYALLGNSTD